MERGRTLQVFAPSSVTRSRRDSLITGGLFLHVKVGLITLAFKKLGLPSCAVFSLLLLTLIGSAINIPIKRIPGEGASAGQVVEFLGWRFRIPAAGRPSGTVIAVNLGGAIIPGSLCFYHFYKWPRVIWADLVGVAVVALIVHRMARVVRGAGITAPAPLPPIVELESYFLTSAWCCDKRKTNNQQLLKGRIPYGANIPSTLAEKVFPWRKIFKPLPSLAISWAAPAW